MIDFQALAGVNKLLFEAKLQPLQTRRFQPTGFPDLGPAEFEADGTQMLLVESTQSMANRLEAVCWDDARADLVEVLSGIPYVAVDAGSLGTTSSILEFHRLNSPYILSDEGFLNRLRADLGISEKGGGAEDVPGALDLRRLASVVFKYDPGSVMHGVFLEKIAGRLRLQRLLSAFVEATDVRRVESGGVKFDRLDPTGKASGGAKEGFGNVPHHRIEFTAREINAYFNLDLATLRGYGLPAVAQELIIALALWKAVRFLESGLRLRTACDLEPTDGFRVTRPANFSIPPRDQLERELRARIARCTEEGLFASPPVTRVKFGVKKEAKSKKEKKAAGAAEQ